MTRGTPRRANNGFSITFICLECPNLERRLFRMDPNRKKTVQHLPYKSEIWTCSHILELKHVHCILKLTQNNKSKSTQINLTQVQIYLTLVIIIYNDIKRPPVNPATAKVGYMRHTRTYKL